MTGNDPRSPKGRRQDETWARFVERVQAEPQPQPFSEHWERFCEIYSAREETEGPPVVWSPSETQISESNLGRFMAERGFRGYEDLHAWSVGERAQFWGAVIRRLGMVFARDPEVILDPRSDPRDPHWLPGALGNCVDSCFNTSRETPAVLWGDEEDGDIRMATYGELERLVNRVAGGLLEHGFEPGDRIALYMPMTLECVAAYLGIVRAGCGVVSIADSFSPGEVRRRIEIAGARGVVTVAGYRRGGRMIDLYRKVREARAPRAIVIADAGDEVRLRAEDLTWAEFLSSEEIFESKLGTPDGVINVLFSSGTTGTPKAIPWTHLTPIKCAMDGHFHQDIRPQDVVAWPTNIGWMMGPWLIFATLLNRATMALYSGAPQGEGFVRFIREAGVRVLGVVPSLVRAWRSEGTLPAGTWDRIRVFSSTGEPSNREDYLWLMSRSGYRAPVIEYLGGTEIGGGFITGSVVQPASPATFTTPALGIDFVLLDEEGRPADRSGELFLIPPAIGLSQTLLNADHGAVYHAGCPTGPDHRTLRRHGDRFRRLPGGFYKAEGRADDTMNLGGIKISSVELEEVVNRHPAVGESAAVGVQIGGEGGEMLVVFLVLEKGIDRDRLRAELGTKLARELNPLFRIHDLIVVDSLPRTASNKVMRRTLRARYRGESAGG